MSFSISNKLSLIDSFQFLCSSLDSLVKNLAKDDFKYLSQEFDNKVLDLVKQKVFYRYDKEYERVLKVWNKFEMKTMKNYCNLYLKCGVLLLADVFEKFRNNSLKNYGLCPSHYLSAPALSWDAMLNMIWNSNLIQILTCTYSLKKV